MEREKESNETGVVVGGGGIGNACRGAWYGVEGANEEEGRF